MKRRPRIQKSFVWTGGNFLWNKQRQHQSANLLTTINPAKYEKNANR